MLLLIICFPIICLSVFHIGLDDNSNLRTIRTVFSSTIGYILEKCTCCESANNKWAKNKIMIVGVFAIVAIIVVILSYILKIDVNNSSLVFIRNLLFSAIGFLTSSSIDSCNKNK